MQQKYALMKALIQRNKANHTNQGNLIFPLPLVLVKADPSMVVEYGENDVEVTNCTQEDILGDMEILKIVL